MGSFEKEVEKTFNLEGEYQCYPKDSANWIVNEKGIRVCIGTKHGISAQALQTYTGKIPTVADVKAITKDLAKLIFKKNYWDKIGGDYIANQSVAALMFQYIIGAGSSQLSDLKDIADSTAKKNVLNALDTPITKADADFINSIDQAQYHANLKAWRFTYYDLVVARDIAKWELEHRRKITEKEALAETKKMFLKGWQNRLNTHVFVK